MIGEEHEASPSVEQMAKLAHERLGTMSDLQNARGLDAAMSGLAQIKAGKGKRFGAAWLVRASFMGALGVALWLGGSALLREKPLTYSIQHGEIQAGGVLPRRCRGPQANRPILRRHTHRAQAGLPRTGGNRRGARCPAHARRR